MLLCPQPLLVLSRTDDCVASTIHVLISRIKKEELESTGRRRYNGHWVTWKGRKEPFFFFLKVGNENKENVSEKRETKVRADVMLTRGVKKAREEGK